MIIGWTVETDDVKAYALKLGWTQCHKLLNDHWPEPSDVTKLAQLSLAGLGLHQKLPC
jgi:hypothetical protein